MEKSSLSIIGAGPKAIALVCKRFILKELGFIVPDIYLIEQNEVGSHWNGKNGYTTGSLPLGTSPDKDLGFPYCSNCWGDEFNEIIDQKMQRFSWQSFLISQKKYPSWVDRGRPAPSHSQWSQYLNWAFDQVKADINFVKATVKAIHFEESKWKIDTVTTTGETGVLLTDGLVMTGPGNEFIPGTIVNDPRILRVKTFWKNLEAIRQIDHDLKIAVVGTGENAASITVSLAELKKKMKVDIISPFAMNYSRGESFVENHMYTDPFRGNWHHLTPEDRRNFINRTDRGVFSVETKRKLDHMEFVEVIPGRFLEANVDSANQLLLVLEYSGRTEKRIYDFIIMATGFDPLSTFKKFLTKTSIENVIKNSKLNSFEGSEVELKIDENLAIDSLYPKLHLPMLAGVKQGPGFPNLSCLGRLSDQILLAHTLLDVD
jgi:mycobactin lysine-N-oxygenase